MTMVEIEGKYLNEEEINYMIDIYNIKKANS